MSGLGWRSEWTAWVVDQAKTGVRTAGLEASKARAKASARPGPGPRGRKSRAGQGQGQASTRSTDRVRARAFFARALPAPTKRPLIPTAQRTGVRDPGVSKAPKGPPMHDSACARARARASSSARSAGQGPSIFCHSPAHPTVRGQCGVQAKKI